MKIDSNRTLKGIKEEDTMKVNKRLKDEKGMALVVVLSVIVLMSLIGTSILFSSNTGKKISTSYRDTADAFQNADAGIADAARKLLNQGIVGNGNPNWSYVGYTQNLGNKYTVSYVVREDNSGNKNIVYDEFGKPLYQIVSVGYVTPAGGDAYVVQEGADKGKLIAGTLSGSKGVEKRLMAVVKMNGAGSTFDCGVFGDEGVALKGQGYVDSYDSTLGNWSGEGVRRNGHVGTNAKGSGVINLTGQPDIYGNAIVGPGGLITDVTTSGQAEVHGEKNVAAAKKDMTPKQDPHDVGTSLTLSGTMTVPEGTYRANNIHLTGQNQVTIGGNVILYVDGNFKTSGQSKLKINPGASLTMYVNGTIDMAGQGIVNLNQKPEKVVVYGTATCGDVKLAGQAVLYAAIYAPKAAATFTGQADIFGSVITRNITVTGQGSIHYDESLKSIGAGSGGVTGYKMLSWKEL